MTEDRSNRFNRTLAVSLTLCASVLLLGAWWYYTRQRESLESSVSAELTAIANVKARQIANWRNERIGDGNVLLSAPIAAGARAILSNRASAADRAELQDVLERFIDAFHYAGAALVDSTGELRFEVKRNRNHSGRPPTIQVPNAGNVLLSDLYLDGGTDQPWMSLTVPIPKHGALILDIDPSTFLFPYVLSWPTMSRTGETILIRREETGLTYLSEGRHTRGQPLWRRRSWDMVSPGTGALHRWMDYRGVPVMGVVREIPGSNWYLIAKIDAAEVQAQLQRLGWGMALVIALIAVTNAAGAGLIWRNRQVRIYRDREAWFRQITNDTPAYLWMTSPGIPTWFINRRCARFFGTDQDQLDGLWQDYVHPDDREQALDEYSTCVRSQCDYRDEFRLRRFDGAYRWMVIHGLARYDPAGAFVGYAGAFTDVTERREAEEHLQSANQALASELRERTRSEEEVHALSSRLINAQEEERTRLARELHDDLSQQIAAASIATGNLKKRIPAEMSEAVERCNRIHEVLVKLAASMRRLSHELHPAVLEHSGLAAALRRYCSELSGLTSHRVTFRTDGRFDSLSPAVSLCAYRVAQEALQNSIKHARVEEADVILTCADGMLTLVVSDHGVGMEPGAAGGLGLVSMRERTRLVHGSVEVQGKPGEGVTVTLKIPVPEPKRAEASAGG